MTLVECPSTLVRQTLEVLREAGLRGTERVVFWLGSRHDNRNAAVAEVYVPQQSSSRDYFHIPSEGMISFMTHLRRRRLILLAQVHSHPQEAFHSPADDKWAVVRHVDGLSIVVPEFAARTRTEEFATAAAIFRLTVDDHWIPVTRDELHRWLQIR